MNRFPVSIALFAAVLCCVPAAHAAPSTYRLVEFQAPDPATQTIEITGINNLGEVVYTLFGGGTSTQYLWRNGVATPLGGLSTLCGPGTTAETGGINDLGEIMITVQNSSFTCSAGFIWHHGSVTPLGPLPTGGYNEISANGINDLGQVVGTLSGPAPTPESNSLESQFVWQDGKYTLLPPLPNGDMYYPGGASVDAINNVGVIAGTSGDAQGFMAVLWIKDKIVNLGACPGIAQSGATDVNDLGVVTGGCQGDSDVFTPFVWKAGKFTILSFPPGDTQSGNAAGINDLGQIVGQEYPNAAGTGPGDALLWQDGAVYSLNTLVARNDPLKPYTSLDSGNAITNTGYILALGQDSRDSTHSFITYLLIPVR